MAWYKTGKVAVTQGQTSITGTGTRFASNARVGDAFRGPDGNWYEVVNIASETVLGIFPAYQGASATDAVYVLAPMQGYVKESADRLREITQQLRDVTAEVEQARQYAEDAGNSATSAATSETNSKTSETNAKTSETNAKASETAANTSKTQAAASATAASGSATAAATSATNAKTSETNSKTSETNAAASAASALSSKNAAATSETNAKTSETNAKTSETNAKASETAAAASKTAAASSASSATASQTAAATSATQASGSATAAANSRTAALASENKAKAWADNPEDTAVETGKYSALHWAAKAKKSADDAAAVTGPRLTSIATAVMAVNDMLIADSDTTMTKIATGAVGRSILGATTAAGARTNLELGTAALSDAATTQTDTTPGRLMRVGDWGLGQQGGISMPDMTVAWNAGFYVVPANAPGLPADIASTGGIFIAMRVNFGILIQTASTSTRRMYHGARGGNTGTITWREVLNVGDYGFGSSTGSPSLSTTAMDATNTPNGLYRLDITGSAWKGLPVDVYAVWINRLNSTTASVQIAVSFTNGKVYTRGSTAQNFEYSIKPGDFGVGTTVAPLLSSFNVTEIPSGFYSAYGAGSASATPGAPPGSGNVALSVFVSNGLSAQQKAVIAIESSSSATSRAFFGQANGTTMVWRESLLVGDYGLGSNVSPLLADFNDNTTPNGTYRVTTATLGTHPGTQFGTCKIEHYDNSYVKQTFSGNANTGLAGLTYTRFYNNGTWTAWTSFINRGDYGLGSYAARMTPAQIEALNPESGFYEVQPQTTIQWPSTPFPNGWTRMLHIRHNNNAGYWSQMAFDFNLRPRIKVRGMSNGTIGEWAEVYSQISILGTVGQAAGVPTGAIIERGFNTNGQYTKFADGTMIQWGVYIHATDISIGTLNSAGGYRSAQIQVPFPTAFIQRTSSDEQPIGFNCYIQNSSVGMRAYPADDSSTVVGQFVLQTVGSAFTVTAGTARLRWMAIGRWY